MHRVAAVESLKSLLSYRRLPHAHASHMRLYTTIATVLLTFALASPAAAQEKPFGITLGYPVAIGALWQVGERVALRPEFTVGYSNEQDSEIGLESSAWRFGIATSAILSIYRNGPRHIYGVPYYEFQKRNATLSYLVSFSPDPNVASANFTMIEVDTHENEHTLGGLIGFELRLTDRSALFAEAGPGYRTSTRRASPIPALPPNHTPLPFDNESLNRNDDGARVVARVGVNMRF